VLPHGAAVLPHGAAVLPHGAAVLPHGAAVLPHGASSKEKAILAIHPRSSERGILAFSREGNKPNRKSRPGES